MNVEQLRKIKKLLEEDFVKPMVDSVVPLEQVANAFGKAASCHENGRMMLSVP